MKDLFDLSFDRFVVPKLVRLLYAAWLVAAGLLMVGGTVMAVARVFALQSDIDALASMGSELEELSRVTSQRNFALAMVPALPVVAAVMAVAGRISAEMTIVVFSIAESLKRSPRQ
jgi:hypothetical protein